MSKTVEAGAADTLSAESKGGEYFAIGRVAEEVNAALRAGRQPDVEALAAEHAELAGQIREGG